MITIYLEHLLLRRCELIEGAEGTYAHLHNVVTGGVLGYRMDRVS